jgi:hypothetical protein
VAAYDGQTWNILRGKKCKLERNDYTCPMCSEHRQETTFHIFFSCPFSAECWRHVGINWNLGTNFHQMMMEARQQWQNPFFMEFFMLGAWLIWKQRNGLIFNNKIPSFESWKTGFLQEASLQAHLLLPDKQVIFHSLLSLYS